MLCSNICHEFYNNDYDYMLLIPSQACRVFCFQLTMACQWWSNNRIESAVDMQ